jgi:CPA1 family monovalent cation:H+ antiporter
VPTSGHDELVILGLLAAVGALLVLSRIVRIPYPILFVLGGLALGFVPGVPEIELDPELVFVAFLPPLLYAAAFFTSLRELRANVKPISLLSIGLVLCTMVAVALVAHALVDGMPWAAAFALGAIVSPTDPIAATSIARRLGVGRRVVSIVEGEALINDGTALVAYKFAVAAVVTGSFSLLSAELDFLWSVAGGIGIGLAVAYCIRQVRRRINHPPTEIAIALLSGYLAFLPADALGASGILAAVVVGIYMGWYTPELTTAETRLQGQAVWEIVSFGLNAILFGLVGLQLPAVLDALSGYTTLELVGYAAAVAAVVIVVRFAFVAPFTYLLQLNDRLHGREPMYRWRGATLVSWMGMRGSVSLAAALALPLATDAGDPFPDRSLIVFLTFCVILTTLVLQGLTLPSLIRGLRLPADEEEEREEVEARIAAAEAAVLRLNELAGEDWVNEETAERLRGLYEFRRRRFEAPRRRRRRHDRGTVAVVPAPDARGPGRPAPRVARPPAPASDQRRRHEPGRPGPRPRGHEARHLAGSGAGASRRRGS